MLLWEKWQRLLVANLARQDGIDFVSTGPRTGIVTRDSTYWPQHAWRRSQSAYSLFGMKRLRMIPNSL